MAATRTTADEILKEYYGDRGYINADVTPDPQLDEATKRVNLTYHIAEHELAYINRIDIRGNLTTKDIVVNSMPSPRAKTAKNGYTIRCTVFWMVRRNMKIIS